MNGTADLLTGVPPRIASPFPPASTTTGPLLLRVFVWGALGACVMMVSVRVFAAASVGANGDVVPWRKE
jgi:hypothetical protein